jgi:hypothetical protein
MNEDQFVTRFRVVLDLIRILSPWPALRCIGNRNSASSLPQQVQTSPETPAAHCGTLLRFFYLEWDSSLSNWAVSSSN